MDAETRLKRIASTVRWQKANPDRVKSVRRERYARKRAEINSARRARYDAEAIRAQQRLSRYGVSQLDYDAMLSLQGGHCALCPRAPGRRVLAVDHDHKTGRVRGLLCNPCNAALHPIDADPKWIARALAYLENPQ